MSEQHHQSEEDVVVAIVFDAHDLHILGFSLPHDISDGSREKQHHVGNHLLLADEVDEALALLGGHFLLDVAHGDVGKNGRAGDRPCDGDRHRG